MLSGRPALVCREVWHENVGSYMGCCRRAAAELYCTEKLSSLSSQTTFAVASSGASRSVHD